jgi:hypothetical protein
MWPIYHQELETGHTVRQLKFTAWCRSRYAQVFEANGTALHLIEKIVSALYIYRYPVISTLMERKLGVADHTHIYRRRVMMHIRQWRN